MMKTLVTAIALTLAITATAQAQCPNENLQPNASNVQQVNEATLCLINEHRVNNNLKPLVENSILTQASVSYSGEMVEHGFFSHVTPDGLDVVERLTAIKYIPADDWTVGENIAWAEGYLSMPSAIVKAWMASSGHKANILNPTFEEIGLGIVLSTPKGSYGATYTTDFGMRRFETPAPVVVKSKTAVKKRKITKRKKVRKVKRTRHK